MKFPLIPEESRAQHVTELNRLFKMLQ